MKSIAKSRTRLLVCTALASIGFMPVQALAAPADGDKGSGLQEIIVTAQKREQNVQDVPIAVTAITGASLADNRVVSVADLSGLAPGLTVNIAAGGSQLPAFSIRGVTSYGVVPGSDKEVSIYLDGVYISSPRGEIFNLPDAQSLEVLRGPQGTLFGRNATAGAISITTRDPNGKLGAEADFTIGNYDQRRERVTLSSPQIGPFSAYVTFVHNYKRGDVRNTAAGTPWDRTVSPSRQGVVATAAPYLGTVNADSWFAAVKFQPTANFKIVYKYDDDEENGSPAFAGVAAYAPGFMTTLVADHPEIYAGAQRPDVGSNGYSIGSQERVSGHNFTATWNVADNITVKNVFAMRQTYMYTANSLDGFAGITLTQADANALNAFNPYVPNSGPYNVTGLRFGFFTTEPESQSKQWSDELQVNYHSQLLTLTGGLMWFKGRDYVGAPLGLQDSTPFFFSYNGIINLGTVGRYFNDARSLAAYGQAEVHITPKVDLVLGARITKDDKTGSIDAGTNPPSLDPATWVVVPFTYSKTKPNWLVGVNYKPDNTTLLYAKFSTAFVSGGSVAGAAFPPETATSWEAGLKAEWLDRHLRTNLAVYAVTYDNLQTAQGGGSNSIYAGYLDNIGSHLTPPVTDFADDISSFIFPIGGPTHAKGFEFEGTVLFGHGLTAGGDLSYTHTTYSNVNSNILASNGNEYLPTLQPDWTGGLWGQFTSQPLLKDAYLTARMDAHWHDKYLLSAHPDVTNPLVQPAWVAPFNYAPAQWIINGRVAIENIQFGGVTAEVALWGKNLTQNRDINYALNLGYLLSASYQPARTLGADLNIKF